jgi:hypothetical protein
MELYITHCCAKKNNQYRNMPIAVAPHELYTATPTKRFMMACQRAGVRWAIFSDKYGVWFPEVKHPWYEKDPRDVTPEEFAMLVRNFDESLAPFSTIAFYHNPGRFHPLYGRLLEESVLRDRVRMITHLAQIGG